MKQFRLSMLVAVAASLLAGADGRRKLWELNLAPSANGKKDVSAVVWGISFSPDESKVAIGFGPYSGLDPSPQHVVIVPVGSPSLVLREFDVSLKNYVVSAFSWSPSGTKLVVGDVLSAPVILSMDKEPACRLPELSQFGGFLRDDLMVLTVSSEVQILRRDCSLIETWKTAGHERVVDTSPEQDLIAVLNFSAEGGSVSELVTGTHEVKQRWIHNAAETAASGGGFHFADQGRLFCSGFAKEPDRSHVECRNTQTGSILATNSNVVLWGQSIHSSGGGLLAITDYNITDRTATLWKLLDAGGTLVVPRRGLIWNIRTGREIASWTGRRIQPVFVLSPNGKYIAEGGFGSVWVYALPG